MSDYIIGVFSSSSELRGEFLDSVGKKNETEGGIAIYQRTEKGSKYSLLDDASYPERIQGYLRMASICDHALFVLPDDGKLSSSDGEIAILLDSLAVDGTLLVRGSGASESLLRNAFSGLRPGGWKIQTREKGSSILNVSDVKVRPTWDSDSLLVFVDRCFNVKGVGLVILGFVLSGTIRVHDKLRPIPSKTGKTAEVRGIQLNDVDVESAGRGARVGLSLKGVELEDIEKSVWFDDGSRKLSSKISFSYTQSKYYKKEVTGRDLHFEYCGELYPAKIQGENGTRFVDLPSSVPLVEDLAISLADLNAKVPRVAGGGKVLVSGSRV